MRKNAIIDSSGNYRYLLSRIWEPALPKLLYIMLNPSKANETNEDKTSEQCLYFARKFNFGSFEIVNLYGLISTNPKNLKKSLIDPIGDKNDYFILEASFRADKIIVGWGSKYFFNNRNIIVTEILKKNGYKLFCFGKTIHGHPRHLSRLKHNITGIIEY